MILKEKIGLKMEIIKLNEKNFELYKKDINALMKENYRINLGELEDIDIIVNNKCNEIPKFLINGSAYILVCVEEKKAIAFLWAYQKEEIQEKMIHVSHIIVKENYQRKGIGKILMENLENEMKKRNIYIVDLVTTADNNKAMNFYKKSGFQVKRVFLRKKISET